MLRAIAAAKKKNDRIDADKFCDSLRCDFLPECYMAPTAIRERPRTLRYRNLLARQMVQMKIKIGSLLMEAGVSYNQAAAVQDRLFPRAAGNEPAHRAPEATNRVDVQKAEDLMHEAMTERLRTCLGRRHVSGTAGNLIRLQLSIFSTTVITVEYLMQRKALSRYF